MQTTKQDTPVVGHPVVMAAWNQWSTLRIRQNVYLAECLDPHIIMAVSRDEAMCVMILEVDLFQFMKRESPADWS